MAEAYPVAPTVTCCPPVDRKKVAAWWRIGVGAIVAVNAMTVDLALNTTDALPSDRQIAHGATLAATLIAFALLGWPLLHSAVRELARRRVTIEAMFLAGILGAFSTSLIAVLTGEGAVYFEVVSILLVVYALGQQLTGAAQQRALAAARVFSPLSPTCTVVADDGATTTIPVSELRAGLRVRVAPGELVSADGIVATGEGFVREAEMTGEFFATLKRPGDPVWAGTCSIDAAFEIEATTCGTERRIDRVLEAVERARAVPSSVQRQADRLAARFLPMVLLAAGATFAGWTWSAAWSTGLFNAMAVLLIACPCAVGLATPLAAWAAIGSLARRGLIVRGGDAIERLAAVSTVVFDKTGTLTGRRARLVDLVVDPSSSVAEPAILAMLEAVERLTDHPVAAAFHGIAVYPTVEVAVTNLRLVPATGLEAAVRHAGERHVLRVGVPDRLLRSDQEKRLWESLRRRVTVPPGTREAAVVLDNQVVGAAVIGEEVRETWAATLDSLQRLGVHTVVMTGDLAERARRLGVGVVHAGLSPEDKLHLLRSLQSASSREDEVGAAAEAGCARSLPAGHARSPEPGPRTGRRPGGVAYVGDGVNDAAAMAASDVSIAVAEGAELATEIADVTWHGGDLRTLPWAIDRARHAVRTIRSNLAFALAYNFVGMLLAAAGMLHPVVAALLMTGSSLIVTLRAVAGADDSADNVEAAGLVLPGTVRAEGPREVVA